MDFKLIYLARRNPSIKAEDWPRAWRSHAIFASQFPVINATVRGLFYCSRIFEPMLDGAPFEPPGVSRDYDGVGIASGPEPVRVALSSDDQARIDEDELRVFDTYSRSFSFHCKETMVHGGSAGKAAVIRFLSPRTGSTQEAFLAHLNRHATTAQRAADVAGTVTRSVHNTLMADAPPGYPFEAITETWFASAEDAQRAFADRTLSLVTEDLATFCDLSRSVTLLTRVIHRWPRD